MSVDLKEIGQRIFERRRELRYTQEQLAEKMEVSVQMVSNLERGNKAIRIDNLVALSEILNVSTDYILTGRRSPEAEGDLAGKINGLDEKSYQMLSAFVDYCLDKNE